MDIAKELEFARKLFYLLANNVGTLGGYRKRELFCGLFKFGFAKEFDVTHCYSKIVAKAWDFALILGLRALMEHD
jgi:hypothetical protein